MRAEDDFLRDPATLSARLAVPRSVISAGLLTEFAQDYGVDRDALYAGTGIDPDVLGRPDGEITAAQELALVGNLVAATDGVPALGLEAGTRYHLTTHGPLGFAVMSSPTVRAALDVVVRFADLTFSYARIAVEPVEEGVRIAFDDRDVAARMPPAVRRFLAERDLVALETTQREVLGGTDAVVAVQLAHPAPAYADRYAGYLPCEPRFGADVHALIVDPATLDVPLPQAELRTTAIFEQHCHRLLAQRRRRVGLSGAVRAELVRRPADRPSQADVAAALAMSERTVRRRLALEGTSFQELVDETTSILARELLDGGLTVEETAHRLGYSGASSFSHAFRRWTGTTPGGRGTARR
ncbi:unannotated protein [freshwater metagenome]|uniref:Unannotated protein n=1 Tax=freshwater metagenome TaxID=449393 RepID=A0A6J7HH16_9ZZZZ|nr:helix-turn-helix domain-containing protein [Actinomycetota bacterium]